MIRLFPGLLFLSNYLLKVQMQILWITILIMLFLL